MAVAVWPRAEAADLIRNVAVGGAQVAVAEGKHRIEVHSRAAFWHQAGNDPRGRLVTEQLRRDLKHRLSCGAFAHADQHDALSNGHDVAAFERGRTKRGIAVAPPDVELATGEAGMKLVDSALEERLRLPRRPEH